MSIEYVKGDATQPIGAGNHIIAHICNDIGRWGKGFVVAISQRWPEPEKAYKHWYKHRDNVSPPDELFRLGAIQLVSVESNIWVCNMIAQHGIATRRGKTPDGKPPIRYDALAEALSKLATRAQDLQATIHMPRIGCGLAGGSWDEVEAIVQRELVKQGINVFVYDL